MKAMIVNRVGDLGVVMGIVLCYAHYGSVEYGVIMTVAGGGIPAAAIGGMLLIGAIGKSAQIGLHT